MSALREKHTEYSAMSDRWELCSALYGGEHEVHEKGETYLPRLQDEDNEAYSARLKMTPVFGAYFITIKYMRGMLFRKPPTLEVPESILPLLEDIDVAGSSWLNFAQEVAEDAMVTGRVGLLVDYPQTIANATKADAAALNYRPMIVKYDAKAIYNWREERVNGIMQTSQVRLEESVEVQDPADEFKVKTEKRYRVLDLHKGKYRQRLFRVKQDAGTSEEETLLEEFFPTMNGANLDYIPFEVIGADCLGLEVSAPPFIDLATTVLHHYMQSSAYERGCFFSGLPTMFISGVHGTNADGTPFEISIGGNLANILPQSDAKAYYVEVGGDFTALRTNLEDKKLEMAVLGARFLEQQKAGVEAADAIARRMSGEESALSIMAQIISQGLTIQLQRFSDWAGATGEASIALTRDFMPAGITAQDMLAIIDARDRGAISNETMFDNIKAGEIIAHDISFDDEQERINSSMAGMGAPPATEPLGMGTSLSDAEPAPDIEAILQTMTDQHQAVLDQILQAISAQSPVPATLESTSYMPSHDMSATVSIEDYMKEMGDQHAAGMAAIADAMGKEQPAPVINVGAPVVNVTPAAPPAINVEAPVVNVAAPVINMPEQPITVNMPEQQPANVTVNNLPPEGKRAITVERDASGKIIGAIAE